MLNAILEILPISLTEIKISLRDPAFSGVRPWWSVNHWVHRVVSSMQNIFVKYLAAYVWTKTYLWRFYRWWNYNKHAIKESGYKLKMDVVSSLSLWVGRRTESGSVVVINQSTSNLWVQNVPRNYYERRKSLHVSHRKYISKFYVKIYPILLLSIFLITVHFFHQVFPTSRFIIGPSTYKLWRDKTCRRPTPLSSQRRWQVNHYTAKLYRTTFDLNFPNRILRTIRGEEINEIDIDTDNNLWSVVIRILVLRIEKKTTQLSAEVIITIIIS